MATFTKDLQNAEMWPIKAKGAVTRFKPFGDPGIVGSGGYYHQALEDGRLLERNIGDAQHWLLQKKKDLMEKINMYTNMNSLAIDGKLSDLPRSIKYVYDSIQIVKGINSYQSEIIDLISAVTQNIGILQSMELNLVGMVQQNLNALANTLNEICNWGLPDLPAIPNLFSDTIWHWNGFNFVPLGAFALTAKSLKFDTNFAFNQCVLHVPNINIFRNYPTSIQTYSGLQYGTIAFAPPLGGLIPNTGQVLSDPNFIKTMQNTQGPYFLPPSYAATNLAVPFNVNNSMQGAVPNPATIISNYQMPSAEYQGNIISIVPALASLTIEPSDADYANPNLAVRQPELRKALVHNVTLEQVVASNYDPNLTAAWLFYLASARGGRLGAWIENFQVAYVQLVSPSITYLAKTPTPWNCVLPSTTISNAPKAIPLIGTLTGTDATTRGNLLWQLSYVEASLLGYTRAQDWDAYANANYVGTFTGTDLDYTPTTIDPTVTSTVTLGANGEAEYPTPCTYPSAIGNVLHEVLAIADTNIKNTPKYTTSRPQFKYIYDQFAQAKLVDRFTQFWREFNANLQALLLQDSYLIQFVVSYPAALDSAIDPLGDPTIYNQLKADAATRNRTWVPGYPLLPIPKAPVVAFTTTAGVTPGQSGWQGTSFDPNTFLLRPDIQQLPIGTQIAMLRTNLSYAATQQQGSTMSTAIQAAIAQQQFLLQDFKNVGWKVEVASAINSVPPGSTGLFVSFDQVDFDLTGNVTRPNLFTVQASGTYAIVVELDWGVGDAAYRTGTLFQNNTAIGSSSTDGTTAGPTAIQMSLVQYLNKGDKVTVQATHGLATAQPLVAGSYISATLTSASAPATSSVPIPPNNTSPTLTFDAETALAPLTAVYVVADGNVKAIDPTTVTTDGAGNPIYPIVTGVTLSNALQGSPVTVGNNYGGVYEYDGAGFTVGGLIYAGVGGALTQNYATVVASCQWIVVVGRAISANQFIYEPHIPNLLNQGTF